MGNNIIRTTNCNHVTAATFYTVEHGLFRAHNCKYPVRSNDDDDDDDDDNNNNNNNFKRVGRAN